MKFQTNVDVKELGFDHKKPTILVVSDSAAIHTGFAQVVRNVWRRLWSLKKWNIAQYGWWHSQPIERVPWPIISTDRNQKNPQYVSDADKYGELSFERVAESVRPDLIWLMADPWMAAPTLDAAKKLGIKSIIYTPVDGAPLTYSWNILEMADTIVPYLPWGKAMIERWTKAANLTDPIPHGVDPKVYLPITEDERGWVKREMFGITEDSKVIMSVARNQARKNPAALIEMLYYLRSGDYQICSVCGRLYRNPYDYHAGKPGSVRGCCSDPACWTNGPPEMEPGEPMPNLYHYIHTPSKDLMGHSYNLMDLFDVFNLGVPREDKLNKRRYPGILWSQDITIAHGMSEADIAKLMAASDVFSVATAGEGFGLPLIEAMCCGTPTVAPDISAHPDFMRGAAPLVPIGYHVCETMSGYYRGYPDLDAYLTELHTLLTNKDYHDTVGSACRKRALEYNWDGVAEKWDKLISSELENVNKIKRWKKLVTI